MVHGHVESSGIRARFSEPSEKPAIATIRRLSGDGMSHDADQQCEGFVRDVNRLADAATPQTIYPPTGIDGFFVMRAIEPTPMEGTIYEPCVCLILQGAKHIALGGETVTCSAGESIIVGSPADGEARAVSVAEADAATVDALQRLLAITENPHDAQVMVPMIEREIHYRLL